MKAYEIQNKPDLDALTLTERPDPNPAPGQVLLKMRAASLNYRDLRMVKGAYSCANTLNKSLRAVRIGGMISLIGVLTGISGDIRTIDIIRKKVRVQGIYVGSREMFEAMNRAIALHGLRPVIDRVFPFEEARAALEYLESGAHFGKICIRF
jgi:NADPH:quinone reductase-like Zn-dependent oxidoreductase